MKLVTISVSALLLSISLHAQEPRKVALTNANYFHQYVSGMDGKEAVFSGKALKPFVLTTPEGRVLKSEELKGKVLVLDFWATWCSPCRKLTAEMDSAFRKYMDRSDFLMVGVNFQEDLVKKESQPVKYWKDHHYAFPMTLNDNVYGKSIDAGNPTVFVVDQEGIVRGRWDAWTPGTTPEIAAYLWALLDKPVVTRQSINTLVEQHDFFRAMHSMDAYAHAWPDELADLAAQKFSFWSKEQHPLEATVYLKMLLDTSASYQAIGAKLLKIDPAAVPVSRDEVFERIAQQYKLKEDYFMYSWVAGNLYKAGYRDMAIKNAEKALQVALKKEGSASPMLRGLEEELKKYRQP